MQQHKTVCNLHIKWHQKVDVWTILTSCLVIHNIISLESLMWSTVNISTANTLCLNIVTDVDPIYIFTFQWNGVQTKDFGLCGQIKQHFYWIFFFLFSFPHSRVWKSQNVKDVVLWILIRWFSFWCGFRSLILALQFVYESKEKYSNNNNNMKMYHFSF